MRTTTTTTKTAMTVLTSGAVALTLLLAGCTGSDDSSSESSDPSSSASESSAAPESADLTGELAVTTCADAGEALGSTVEGLDLQEDSTEADGQLQCYWANEEATAEGDDVDPNAKAVFVVAQNQEFTAEEIVTQGDAAAEQQGATEVDDERVAAFGGRVFYADPEQSEGLTGSGALVVTPHGVFGVQSATPGDEAPLSSESALDAILLLLK
jgi:hypothetical protein